MGMRVRSQPQCSASMAVRAYTRPTSTRGASIWWIKMPPLPLASPRGGWISVAPRIGSVGERR
jgi:hypothetical protein